MTKTVTSARFIDATSQMPLPSHSQLRQALADAGSAHHDYEQNVLEGVRDELWPGFYAAFALGRLGPFSTASQLSRCLAEAPLTSDWAASAATFTLDRLRSES